MKAIVIGIMPQEKIRAHVLAIARGEYKPKLPMIASGKWCESRSKKASKKLLPVDLE